MNYIYAILDGKVKLVGRAEAGAKIVSQSSAPVRQSFEGHTAVLDYDETEGIRYVYVEQPTEPAGTGKQWTLEKTDGVWSYVQKDRPLTIEERLEAAEAEIEKQKYAWKVGESVNVNDRSFYVDAWYKCLQSHTTQADWTPDVAVSLWVKE